MLFRNAMTERTEREPEVEPDVEQERREGKKTKMPKEDEEVRSPIQSPRWEVRIEEWQRRIAEERQRKLEEDYRRSKREEGGELRRSVHWSGDESFTLRLRIITPKFCQGHSARSQVSLIFIS